MQLSDDDSSRMGKLEKRSGREYRNMIGVHSDSGLELFRKGVQNTLRQDEFEAMAVQTKAINNFQII